MPLFVFIDRFKWLLFFVGFGLFLRSVALAQVNLAYRLLRGYLVADNGPTTKGKPLLIVCDDAEAFSNSFQPAATDKRPERINFAKEMVIGIALPPTTKPPKLSVSKVFVQDSALTIRYIRLPDTTLTNAPQSSKSQSLLVVAIPKQAFLKTKLVENGKVVLTAKRPEND